MNWIKKNYFICMLVGSFSLFVIAENITQFNYSFTNGDVADADEVNAALNTLMQLVNQASQDNEDNIQATRDLCNMISCDPSILN